MEIEDLVLRIMQTCLSKEEIKTEAKRLDTLLRGLCRKKAVTGYLIMQSYMLPFLSYIVILVSLPNLCVNKCDTDAR